MNFKYCPKCGHIVGVLGRLDNLGKCSICSTNMILLPNKYIEDDEITITQENRQKIYEDLVKTSNIFDQKIFNSRDNIIAEKHTQRERVKAFSEARSNQSKNQPKCPTCGSTNIKKVNGVERGTSVAFFGLFSKKIGKQFKCNSCGYMW